MAGQTVSSNSLYTLTRWAYWSKKFDGKILHFGRWGRKVNGKLEPLPFEAGWRDAYANFKARVNDVHESDVVGFVVRSEKSEEDDGELKLADLTNRFLTAKTRKMEAHELSPRSFAEYRHATDLLIDKFGDEKWVRKLAPATSSRYVLIWPSDGDRRGLESSSH